MSVIKTHNEKEYISTLVESIIKSIENHGGKGIVSSIILTGSFGRNEPTFQIDDEGFVSLKSDVEIALVYSNSKQKVEQLINEVKLEFEEELNLMPISEKRIKKAFNFNYSIVVPKYKTIFTYDLFNGSKTIWGYDFLKEQKIHLDACDIYEAKRLVANRLGELVYLENRNTDSYLRNQWRGKVILAIASAWLICEKKYVSSYHGQYKEILNEQNKVSELLGKDFINDYKKVFSFLRENGNIYEIADEKIREYVRLINLKFTELKINKPRVNSLSRYFKYLLKYISTGMDYKIIGFENNILEALIENYSLDNKKINKDADVWHRVLY